MTKRFITIEESQGPGLIKNIIQEELLHFKTKGETIKNLTKKEISFYQSLK
jgi:hypothetical protein